MAERVFPLMEQWLRSCWILEACGVITRTKTLALGRGRQHGFFLLECLLFMETYIICLCVCVFPGFIWLHPQAVRTAAKLNERKKNVLEKAKCEIRIKYSSFDYA